MEQVSSIILFLLHPLVLLFFWYVFLRIIFKRRKQIWIMLMYYLLIGVPCWLLSTEFVLNPMILNLQQQYSVFERSLIPPSSKPYVIVLGSGSGYDDNLPATSLLSSGTLQRLVEGIRIIRMLPEVSLITSAASPIGYRPQAFIARDAAIELGIDSTRIIALPTAGNTHEEAEAFVKFAGKGAKVIVCTSTIHMPRAMEWFRRAGADPIAAPCDFIVKKDDPPPGIKAFIPQPELWKTWQFVLKEYLGLFYFKLKGA